MGQALYRKHRPRSLSEVVGQEHVTKTLSKAIKTGRLSHAYLFSGPKGVGKTSVARILAHEVNKLPYKDESIHLDIIEIDAASNRRIDEIRDLRDKVHIAPTSAKYKVYIIDEVHMLTREAFNALLKTLEEPPEHCIFILATTEPHKLPETIISRTQHFNFRPIADNPAIEHLASIAKSEKISITPEALKLLAEFGEGSFRDSLSSLDQMSASGVKITESTVNDALGLPPHQLITALCEAIQSGNSQTVVDNLDKLTEIGANPTIIAKMLAHKIRQLIVDGHGNSWSTPLLRSLLEVPSSLQPRQYLEISLLEAAGSNQVSRPMESGSPLAKSPSDSEPEPEAEPEIINELEKPTAPKPKMATSKKSFDIAIWPTLLDSLKKNAPTVYAALRLAVPDFKDGELVLAFEFSLHQKKVAKTANMEAIARELEKLGSSVPPITTIVDKSAAAQKVPTAEKPSPETISNIFGGAEVLES